MKILNIAIYPHLTKRKELQGACHMISSQTLEKTGCLDCRVFTGEGEESAIPNRPEPNHQRYLRSL